MKKPKQPNDISVNRFLQPIFKFVQVCHEKNCVLTRLLERFGSENSPLLTQARPANHSALLQLSQVARSPAASNGHAAP